MGNKDNNWDPTKDNQNPTNTWNPNKSAKTNSVNSPLRSKEDIVIKPGVATSTGSKFKWTAANFDVSGGNFLWTNNTQPVAIAFLGDKTGKVIGTKYGADTGYSPGSPMSMDEARSQIFQDTSVKPNGWINLKKMLVEKNYLTGKQARESLSTGNMYDLYVGAALDTALFQATSTNITKASQGDTSFLTFDDWLANSNPIANTTSFGGGGGAGGVSISHQKFRPEDYDIAIDQLFQQTIGRGASDQELKDFVGKLQAYDNKNPQKTVTKVSGNTTSQTTSGGVNSAVAESMLKEEALNNPEAEKYNKATKYLSYFNDALNTPIQLG